MFELMFGLIWELICIPIFALFLIDVPAEEPIAMLPLIIMALIFNGVGILILAIGIKKIAKDKKTDLHGEETFGRVIDVHPNGNTFNGRRQYNALVEVYIKSENKTVQIEEVSGLGRSDYDIGDYVKVKYYNGDINFIEKVYPDYLPVDARTAIENSKTYTPAKKASDPVIVYESADIIQVDGVRYQRIP